jgi:shikimate 5-dehydrogenase
MYPRFILPWPPYVEIGVKHLLFDCIYSVKTIFLSEGKRKGAQKQKGFDMFVYKPI